MRHNVAFDVETTKLPFIHPWQPEAYLVCLSTCDDKGETRTWFFQHEAATKTQGTCIEEIREYLSKYKRVIAHNLKFDLQWLTTLGIDTEKQLLWDTLVVEYLIRGHERLDGLDLNALAEHYGAPSKKDEVKTYWDADVETDDIPAEILQTYCEQDAATAMFIFTQQTTHVNRLNLNMLVSLEMGALRCYHDMEMNGMFIDMRRIHRYGAVIKARLDTIDRKLYQLLDVENPNSPAQLSVALFGGTYKVDGVVPGKREGTTKKGKVEVTKPGLGFNPEDYGLKEGATPGIYSVSKDVLPLLKGKTPTQKEVVKLLGDRSAVSQLWKTYFNSLPNLAIDSVVHPSINQALTKTGRTSCKQPNLQNLPRDNNGPVKRCFVSRFGKEGAILDADLAQIEWRIIADLSGDPVMIDEIRQGRDQHAYTCEHHMEMPVNSVNRTNAKIFNFRAIYIDPKVAPYAYYMDNGMPNFSKKKWQKVVDGFFSHYCGMVNAHNQWIDEVNRKGQLIGPTGRIWKYQREEKYHGGYSPNKVRNYPVQGSAGDIIKLALVRIRRILREKYPEVKMCMAVHDSIIFDMPRHLVQEVAAVCIDVFESLTDMAKQYFNWEIKVPLTGDAKAGPSWGKAKDIE